MWPPHAGTRPATSCLLAAAGDYPERHDTPWTPSIFSSHSLVLSPSMVLSSQPPENAVVAPTSTTAATGHPSPFRRVQKNRQNLLVLPIELLDARRPCFIVIAVVFNLGHPSPSPSICCTPAALEPTDPPNGLTVSPRVISPFSPSRF